MRNFTQRLTDFLLGAVAVAGFVAAVAQANINNPAITAAPIGPAGGDLAGTYPNPTLAWISRTASQTLAIGAGGTLGSNAFTSTGYMPLAGGTFSGGVGFSTTNTLDIGTNATTLAPRTVYAGTSFVGPVGTFTTSASLAAATATTVAIGGATIGTNAIAATGTVAISGNITTSTGNFFATVGGVKANSFNFNNNGILSATADGAVKITKDDGTTLGSYRRGFTIAGLPAGAVTGAIAYVTDTLNAASCIIAVAPVAGGTTYCPVTWSGAAWVGG